MALEGGSPRDERGLVPIKSGWPLRTATGHGVWRLAPPRAQPIARVLALTPAALFVGGLVALSIRSHGGLWIYWMLGKGGIAKLGFLTAAGAGLARLSSRLASWQLRRIAQVRASIASLRGSPAGSLVRVVGVVRAPEPFTSAVSGQPAVLAHYQSRPEGAPPQHEVRGIDFLLELEGGEAVRVAVEDAYFDDRLGPETTTPADLAVVGGAGSGSVRYREALLAPGDTVEAVGVLVRAPDPALSAGPGRSPALRMIIQAGPRMPLLLRKIGPARA
jgi:hypothetical protein